jgi:hypothetical protein
MEEIRQKPKKKVNVLVILLITLFFILGAGAGYFVYDYLTSRNMVDKLNDPEYVSQLQEQQVSQTLEKLEKLMLLPDENPTMATIVDIDALRQDNPTFYANAQEGDLLIIYSEKAILYRESENKIINVAPVFIEPTEGTTEENTEDTTETDTTEETETTE